MFGISKAHWETAAVAVAAYIAISAFQRHVMPVPVVGLYLPR